MSIPATWLRIRDLYGRLPLPAAEGTSESLERVHLNPSALVLKAILTEKGNSFPHSRESISSLQVAKSLTKVPMFDNTGFSNVKTPGKHS